MGGGRGGQISNLAPHVCLQALRTKERVCGGKAISKTDLHVLCLALQRELQLADDGVLLPQRSVQVVLHVLLGPLQVLQGVRQMLQLHVLLFDHGVETLEGTSGAEVELKFERRCLCDSFQTKTQFRAAYVDGFLAVGEQVVEPIKVALPLSKGQLQLVDLVVLLLNGGELLIQRLLRAIVQRRASECNYGLRGEKISPKERHTSRAFSFSFNLCRSLETTLSLPPGLLFCSKSLVMFMYS